MKDIFKYYLKHRFKNKNESETLLEDTGNIH